MKRNTQVIARLKEHLPTYCHNINSDEDFDRVIWWYPLQDAGLPSVQEAAILRTWVYAEGALVIYCKRQYIVFYLPRKQIKFNLKPTL